MSLSLSRWSVRLLYLTVLLSGMATLGVELSASRLLGAVFGSGNVVWASVIGLVMLYLAAGYFIGGRLADRTPVLARLYLMVAWGAFLSGLVPYAARVVLPAVSSLSLPLVAAVSLAIVLLFAAPVVLLGCVSPFAIRLLLTSVDDTGWSAGRVYAWSTLGSVLGSLVSVLYMLPALGVTATFGVFAAVLLVVAALGLLLCGGIRALRTVAWMPVVLVLLWLGL